MSHSGVRRTQRPDRVLRQSRDFFFALTRAFWRTQLKYRRFSSFSLINGAEPVRSPYRPDGAKEIKRA
ncbi:MAG: hypothetical protein QOH70_2536 [Blastocatellia bacterium]|jgi:hypothetical protein|nr:hypothetical protein [Blastocatellia bacterium]